jgi:hypothetical protein
VIGKHIPTAEMLINGVFPRAQPGVIQEPKEDEGFYLQISRHDPGSPPRMKIEKFAEIQLERMRM